MRNHLLFLLLVTPVMANAQIGITQDRNTLQYVFCDKCPPPTPKVMDLPDPAPVIAAAPVTIPVPAESRIQIERMQVQFRLDSSRVGEQDLQALRKLADSLATNNRPLVITGYTDKLGKAVHNKHLAARRANAVKTVLVADGLKSDRMTVKARCCIENPPRRNPKARRVDVEVMP